MDKNKISVKLHNRFPSLPQNALLTIYKAWSKRMRLLMRNNIPADIRWLIEAKVHLASKLPPKFIAYMPGCGKGNYARTRRARRISVTCHNCARMRWDKKPCSLGMMSDNGKIRFNSLGMSWIMSHWMISFYLLKRILVDMYKERFSSYGHYSRKSMQYIVSGIWL